MWHLYATWTHAAEPTSSKHDTLEDAVLLMRILIRMSRCEGVTIIPPD